MTDSSWFRLILGWIPHVFIVSFSRLSTCLWEVTRSVLIRSWGRKNKVSVWACVCWNGKNALFPQGCWRWQQTLSSLWYKLWWAGLVEKPCTCLTFLFSFYLMHEHMKDQYSRTTEQWDALFSRHKQVTIIVWHCGAAENKTSRSNVLFC